MRPGDSSPGNAQMQKDTESLAALASMRPGDSSPGNVCEVSPDPACSCFNEAGGFLPRKLAVAEVVGVAPGHALASMRPGDFSPGNPRHGRVRSTAYRKCFNEAGGFLPRKRGRRRAQPRRLRHASMCRGISPPETGVFGAVGVASLPGFNEAGGFLPRKRRSSRPASRRR